MRFIPVDEVPCGRCDAQVYSPCVTPAGRLSSNHHSQRYQERVDSAVHRGYVVRLLVDAPDEGLMSGEEYLAYTDDLLNSRLLQRVSDGWIPDFSDSGYPQRSVSNDSVEFVRWLEWGEKKEALLSAREKHQEAL